MYVLVFFVFFATCFGFVIPGFLVGLVTWCQGLFNRL